MSWKLWAAAAAALVVTGPSARAGDVFQLALPARDAPSQTLALTGGADTLTVGYRGHYRGGAYYRPAYRGYAYYRAPYRYYPRYSLSLGYGYAPPAYYYAPPVYYYSTPPYAYPMSLGVTTYSLPEGNVTYSVTRPAAPRAEPLPPPVPRDGTFPYDGGPANPVPMPRAEPGPTSAPRYFHIAPLDDLRVSLPDDPKTIKEPARGKFSYPAYGEQPRRAGSGPDRTIIKDEKKSGR